MRQEFSDPGDPKKYWTQIPNMVFELGLTPYELTLYAHMKRAAGKYDVCSKSTRTLARECRMSPTVVVKAKAALATPRRELNRKPLIVVEKRQNPAGGKEYDEVIIVDIWRENTNRFAPPEDENQVPETEKALVKQVPDITLDSKTPTNQVPDMELGVENQVPRGRKPSTTGDVKQVPVVEHKKNLREEDKDKEDICEARPSHTGIALLREVQGCYPPKESQVRYTAILGASPDEKLLRDCRAEWLDRGYNKMSWKWFTDWFAQGGVPERNGQPKVTINKSGEKIVADHGDWYEVEACQGGGTSPRYRTAEAFARLTGRDLETVRAGWN